MRRSIFAPPRVSYNDDFLKIVKACDVPYAVKENVRYQPGVLIDDAAAQAYAASIRPGSIIAIPVSRSVRRPPQVTAPQEEKPAVDMKPTIKDAAPAAARPTVDLAAELDRLLTAFDARNLKTVEIKSLRFIHFIAASAPAAPVAPAAPAAPAGEVNAANGGQ